MSRALSRLIAASGVAAGAMIAATPALAQQMSYEQRVYEYAKPAPVAEQQTVFVGEPVVQATPTVEAQTPYESVPVEQTYEVEYTQQMPAAVPSPSYAPAGHHHAQSAAQPAHSYQAHPQQGHGQQTYQQGYYPQQGYTQPHHSQYANGHGYPPMPPVVDRDAWIADCRAYLRDRRRQADRGAVGGGLLGAVAGGVIGNRVADGERLGGTLIGAGVGGLVGLFIGQAIALAGGDGTKRDCKRWLRTYEDSYANGGIWPGHGQVWQPYPQGWNGWQGNWQSGWNGWQSGGWQQSWGWSGAYVVVPQTTVVVHHQAMVPVIRETVTEEWVEVEKTHHAKPKAHHHPKPKVRYIKSKPRPVKYIKRK